MKPEMSVHANRGSRVFVAISLLLLGTAATAMAFYGMGRYGAGISPDSLAYLSAAKNLLLGKGFKIYNQALYLSWPPLFPIILALAGAASIELSLAARIINAAGFGLIVVLSGYLLLHTIRSTLLNMLALFTILFSLPLLKVSVMVWTETWYTLFSVIFFLALLSYLRSGSRVLLFVCSALAALACLQRYAGITIVITGAASLIFCGQDWLKRTRINNLLIFLFVSATPVLLWLLRNYLVSGTLAGHRYPAYYGLLTNLSLASGVLGTWLFPPFFPSLLRHLVLITVVILGSLAHLVPRTLPDAQVRQRWLKLLVLYCFIYTGFVIIISSLKAFEPIDDRLLAPLYPFCALLLCTAADDWCWQMHLKVTKKQWSMGVIAGMLAVWLIWPISQTYCSLSEWRKDGAGEDFYGMSYYGKRPWQESPLAAWLRTHPPGGAVFSNEPLALYALTGIIAGTSPLKSESLDRCSGKPPMTPESLLVWFHDQFEEKRRFLIKGNEACSISELRELFDLEEMRAFPDGVLYRCVIKGNVDSTRYIPQ